DSGAFSGPARTATTTADRDWISDVDASAIWTAVGTVADNSALLLAADANTRLYFQPTANFNGTDTDAITFRAWDTTSGTAGTKRSEERRVGKEGRYSASHAD